MGLHGPSALLSAPSPSARPRRALAGRRGDAGHRVRPRRVRQDTHDNAAAAAPSEPSDSTQTRPGRLGACSGTEPFPRRVGAARSPLEGTRQLDNSSPGPPGQLLPAPSGGSRSQSPAGAMGGWGPTELMCSTPGRWEGSQDTAPLSLSLLTTLRRPVSGWLPDPSNGHSGPRPLRPQRQKREFPLCVQAQLPVHQAPPAAQLRAPQ